MKRDPVLDAEILRATQSAEQEPRAGLVPVLLPRFVEPEDPLLKYLRSTGREVTRESFLSSTTFTGCRDSFPAELE